MPPLRIQTSNHELNRPLIHLQIESTFTFQLESHGVFHP